MYSNIFKGIIGVLGLATLASTIKNKETKKVSVDIDVGAEELVKMMHEVFLRGNVYTEEDLIYVDAAELFKTGSEE